MKDVETSLEYLGTDYIDVIQLHNLDSPKRAFIPEVRAAYAQAQAGGKGQVFRGDDPHQPGGGDRRRGE